MGKGLKKDQKPVAEAIESWTEEQKAAFMKEMADNNEIKLTVGDKVVEIDNEFVEYLNKHLISLRDNIINEDFLKINLSNKSSITPNAIPNDWKILSSKSSLYSYSSYSFYYVIFKSQFISSLRFCFTQIIKYWVNVFGISICLFVSQKRKIEPKSNFSNIGTNSH